MIDAPNDNRLPWAPAGARVLDIHGAQLTARGEFAATLPTYKAVVTPGMQMVLHVEDTGSDILHAGDTLVPQEHLGLGYVAGMPTVFRNWRGLTHGAMREGANARDLTMIGMTLGLETVRSQLITSQDHAARAAYEERMSDVRDWVYEIMGQSTREVPSEALMVMERSRELIDSIGRFNRCALPLVIRKGQRLLSQEAQLRNLNSASLRVGAASLGDSIDILLARAEHEATQCMALARSPGLNQVRWACATKGEQDAFRHRMSVAINDTIPNIIGRLKAWIVPEPFRSAFALAAEKLERFVLPRLRDVRAGVEGGPLSDMFPRNLIFEVSRGLAEAARILAVCVLSGTMQNMLLPLSIYTRRASSGQLSGSSLVANNAILEEICEMSPLFLSELEAIDDAFGEIEVNPLDKIVSSDKPEDRLWTLINKTRSLIPSPDELPSWYATMRTGMRQIEKEAILTAA